MNKRGQVMIFVIILVVIVGAIVLFFVFKPTIRVGTTQEFDSQAFLGQCLRGPMSDLSDQLISGGGFVNATDTTLYDDKNVVYLCKNINYYEPCVMQHPLYLGEIHDQFIQELGDDVTNCIANLEAELTRRGFEVRSDPGLEYNVTLKPELVELAIQKNITFSKDGTSQSINRFLIATSSPIYDLASASLEIARQEAQFCYFENLGYNLLYRDIAVNKDVKSDSTKIYTLHHKRMDKTLMIAIRGCAIPAGF